MSDFPARGGAGHRRALSNLGGPAEREGDPALASALASALEQAADPEAGRQHIHGFHSYPARLHPTLGRALIDGLCLPGGAVFDPFCGSGTVLVEARLSGRRALGVDLNPLAVRLANLKASGRPAAHREALLARSREVAALADDRRRKKTGASRRYPPPDLEAFAMHVLLELDGLRVGIEQSGELRHDLELVLSSLLTKLSRRAGDSAGYQVEKRIGAGFAARLFVSRTEELVRQLEDYERLLPRGVQPARAVEGDACALSSLGVFDLVVTSPPYPGTYDYLQHHELRLRWLGLDARAFAEGEVGARRHLEAGGSAQVRWVSDLTAILGSVMRQLGPDGKAVLVLADSVVNRRPLYNDDLLVQAAARAGCRVLARASQERPHFHGPSSRAFLDRPRREHAICVVPAPAPSREHAPNPHRSQPAGERRRGR